MIRKISLYVIILLMFSCATQEGEGGLGSIQGVIMVQNINSLFEKAGAPYIAQNEKVYISYGDNTTVDNDVSTSLSGDFIFNYLTPGNYSVYVYSDDSVKYNKNEKITIQNQVTISNKKDKIGLDTIIIYNYVDFNEGQAKVSGSLHTILHYTGQYILNIKDTVPSQDEDIFIKYDNNSEILDKVATSFDGSFQIPNLVPGTYTIFAYSESMYAVSNDPKEIVSKTFVITDTTKSLELHPMYIYKY